MVDILPSKQIRTNFKDNGFNATDCQQLLQINVFMFLVGYLELSIQGKEPIDLQCWLAFKVVS